MKTNVGSADRIIRVLLGLALLGLFFVLEGTVRFVGLFGIILLFTATVSWCPLYSLFGISTCSAKA